MASSFPSQAAQTSWSLATCAQDRSESRDLRLARAPLSRPRKVAVSGLSFSSASDSALKSVRSAASEGAGVEAKAVPPKQDAPYPMAAALASKSLRERFTTISPDATIQYGDDDRIFYAWGPVGNIEPIPAAEQWLTSWFSMTGPPT